MKKITLSKEEKAEIVARIRRYFADELDHTIGVLPAEFLIDFFAAEIGPHFYRRGLSDAQAALARTMEEFDDAIYQLAQKDG
jgi:uncharacterized protein (DUF2164 family)